jgi:site-specific DNA-methyltransferase (adenine-specific)
MRLGSWCREARCPQSPDLSRTDHGLAQPWTGRIWCNPPYGRSIGRWLEKARPAALSGREKLVVCLVLARVDTAWWHDVAACGEVRFLRGPVRFGGTRAGAPFPSAVVLFRNAPARYVIDPVPAAKSA